MRFTTSPIPPGSTLVRVLVGDGPGYDRMIVVTEADGGVHLMGWIGAPLTPAEWKDAAKELFPDAEFVAFERWIGRGLVAKRMGLG